MRLREYPGLLPGVVIAVLLAFALSGRIARATGITRLIAGGLVFGVGIALAATLTPSGEAVRFGELGSGTCDLGRMAPASIAEILEFGETGLNVLLFVPLGIAVGLLPRSRMKVAVVLAAIALPFTIEWIQLVVTPLGRKCQSADIFDNVTGLVIGFAVGGTVGWLLSRGEASQAQRGERGE